MYRASAAVDMKLIQNPPTTFGKSYPDEQQIALVIPLEVNVDTVIHELGHRPGL